MNAFPSLNYYLTAEKNTVKINYKQAIEDSDQAATGTKQADTTASANQQVIRDHLAALDQLYKEKQNLFDRFEDERHTFFLEKLDEFMAKTFLKARPLAPCLSYRQINLSESNLSEVTSAQVSLETLEIVETTETNNPAADFDNFFTSLIQNSEKLNEETDLNSVYLPLNESSLLFLNKNCYSMANNLYSRKFSSDFSICTKQARNQIDLIGSGGQAVDAELAKKARDEFSSSSMSDPREWFSANSVMELSDRYIAHFEDGKNKEWSGEICRRELKNYRLIKAYLKTLDGSEEECLGDMRNRNSDELSVFNNYSMPDLNWSRKITEKEIQIVRNDLENFNENVQVSFCLILHK